MDFTREPIIETVITPRDGHRIVVRSSKNPGQEEFFVDALEVVTFGHSCFFRSLERPRAFIVPVSDYEVLEVREPRIPLKAPSIDGVVKIGGSQGSNKAEMSRGQSASQSMMNTSHATSIGASLRDRNEERRESRSENKESNNLSDRRDREFNEPRETVASSDRRDSQAGNTQTQSHNDRKEVQNLSQDQQLQPQQGGKEEIGGEGDARNGVDRRRDRRRNLRRRRGGRMDSKQEEGLNSGSGQSAESFLHDETDSMPRELSERDIADVSSLDVEPQTLPQPVQQLKERNGRRSERASEEELSANQPSTLITSILPPPTTLIRDELARLRNNELYKGAFYIRDQDVATQSAESVAPQNEAIEEDKNDDDEDFIVSSSLRFDDDDDDSVNSDAYKATPIGRKEMMNSSSKKRAAIEERAQVASSEPAHHEEDGMNSPVESQQNLLGDIEESKV